MKRFVFALVLLSGLAAAIDFSPKMIGSAVVDARLSWAVDLGGQAASDLQLKSYDFFSDAHQAREILAFSPFSASEDAFGNHVIVFALDSSAKPSQVYLNARISVDYSRGFQEASASEAQRYLGESEYVLISPEIRSKAAEVAGNASDWVKATRLTEWVHNALEYEGLGFYRDNLLTSQEAFEQRKGKCSEYSHLLIAMLRSQGIPARFVAGFVFTGDDWGPHAWVEAAIDGKWVPFDATYGEGVVLDATHLKFAQAVDQDGVREEITGKGRSLDLSLARIERGASLSFASKQGFPGLVSLNVSVPSQALGEGSIAVVSARVRAARDLAVPLSLSVPTTPVEMKVVDEKDRLLFLRAGEETEVNWTVVVPSSLAENYVYTFPVSVTSLGAQAQANITARKGGAVSLAEGVEVSELSYLSSGDSFKLVCVLRNKGGEDISGASVYAFLDGAEERQSFSLKVGEKKRFEFAFPLPAPGNHEGEIRVVFGKRSFSQKFVLSFSGQEASIPPAQSPVASSTPSTESLVVAGVDARMLAGLAVAILLIVVAVILVLKRSRPYSDF
ncbi:MAG: transglutaminase domain-containing protein [Candidatus Micrarchaeia archaeon]